LFPLFLAGADTSSPHQIHYAGWCIGEIKHATGFQHPAMTELLTKVWEERQTNPNSGSNVPWMEFVCLTTPHTPRFPFRNPLTFVISRHVPNYLVLSMPISSSKYRIQDEPPHFTKRHMISDFWDAEMLYQENSSQSASRSQITC
jgi:hypothetical protein